MWPTRLIADIDGPTTFLAQRPGAHVFIEVDFGCANIEIFCEDVRLRASMVPGAGLVEYFIRNTWLFFFEPGCEPDYIFGRVPIDAPVAHWHTAAAYSLGHPSVAQD
eukprot:14878658-Alexandrium_andersonii.AAC.1